MHGFYLVFKSFNFLSICSNQHIIATWENINIQVQVFKNINIYIGVSSLSLLVVVVVVEKLFECKYFYCVFYLMRKQKYCLNIV